MRLLLETCSCTLPIHANFPGDFPIVQYANDILIIMQGDANQLLVLKSLLRSFVDSSGLHVNYEKSFLVPINMDDDKAQHLANTLGCKVGTMPFTYLGLPLGTTKPIVSNFLPILTRVEKRLIVLNKLLTYSRRLLMVNSVVSALPTFYMCTLKVPATILKQIDKYNAWTLAWRWHSQERRMFGVLEEGMQTKRTRILV